MINDKLTIQDETKFEFSLKSTSQEFGELVFDAVILYNFIYDIGADVFENYENRDKKVKEFVKRDPRVILGLLNDIKSNTILPRSSKRDSNLIM